MLFFKPKPNSDELLPPPPPFPSMEFEEELKAKPAQNEFLEQESSQPRFAHLFNDKTRLKSLKIKKRLSKFKQLKPKQTKAAKLKIKQDLDDSDFNFPKDLDEASKKDFVSEKLDFDLESRPQDMIESEEEIKSAIADIKGHEKKSLFGRLFGSIPQEQKIHDSQPMLETQEIDNVSKIKNKLYDARQSLMNFDLKSARENYAVIMDLYNELNPEEQAKVYYEIKNLYYERKSAEGLN